MNKDIPPNPLDEVIADYLKAEESGHTPDPEEWIRRHPQWAVELRDFFSDHNRFKSLAGGQASLPGKGVGHIINLMKKPKGLHPEKNKGMALDTNQGPVEDPQFEDYELEGEIARGGMGIVYRARQISLDRPVALKMMLDSSFARPDDVRRFQQEARAAGRLDHANIVPIYDVGIRNGRQFYTMRLISGGNLLSVLGELRQDFRRATQMMITIARAVDYAHQQGILHRDLKPENILLDTDGTPHITDFGLAKRLDESTPFTQTGDFLGSVLYISPEQAAGNAKQLTPTSDVYSLGAIFYEMLTGDPPFLADSPLELLHQLREQDPIHPKVRNPDIDQDLATICMKCLEKKPDLRYPSAKALADDLAAWLDDRPIQARPPSWGRRLSRWAGRHPVPVAIGIMVLVLSVAIISAVLWRPESHPLPDPRAEPLPSFSLQKDRTVDLAYALMEKGKYAMARQLFEEVIKDESEPLDVMDAEKGLQKLLAYESIRTGKTR